MTITLAAGSTFAAGAGSAASIACSVFGDETTSTADTFKKLFQGQLASSPAVLYTVPVGTATIVKTVILANTTAGAVTATLYIDGTTAAFCIGTLPIPAGGEAIWAGDGWRILDANGALLTSSSTSVPNSRLVNTTAPLSGGGSLAADLTLVLNADGVDNTYLANMAQATLKGRAAAAGTGDPTDLTPTQAKALLAIANTDVSGLGTLSTQSGTFSGTHSGTSSGANTGDQTITLTSDVTGSGTGSFATTLATVNPNVGAFGSASSVGTFTVNGKGLTTAAASTAIQIAESQVTNLVTDLGGKQAADARLTGLVAMPNTVGMVAYTNTNTFVTRAIGTGSSRISVTNGDGGAGAPTIDAVVANFPAATTAAQGMMSALDKAKLDNLWIDVTANSVALVLAANTGAQNITAINAILAAAPNGSTIYFPPGIYLFNAAWTMPNKMFSFLGRGANRAGSPATAFTELRWNTNVAASLIVLPGSGNGWYTTFRSLTFTTTVDQTVGTLFDANGNVGTNFDECSVQSAGGFFNDVLTFGGGAGSNSGNSASINGCNLQGFKGNGVVVNSAGSSLTLTDSIVQGQWGTTAQAATACIRAKWVGALQIIGCDILGGTNNILIDPTAASSEVCASLHCTNTYFDSAFGSCIKVSGTGATVRCKWDTCTFTTNAGGTGFSAVEIAGSFVYAAGGQDLAFVNCNIYNTFGTTGTTNGVLITNAADVSFVNVKVAGWTNGYNITPMASNKTNVQIIGGAVGPSGGYAGNSVGFLIAAGAYKGLQIRGNYCIGNTTAMTLGAVTVNAGETAGFAITDNPGINPRGTSVGPAVPASTVAATNSTGFPVHVVLRAGTITAVSVNGVATGITAAPSATGTYLCRLNPGGTITMTYSVAPTWVWISD